MDQTLHLPPSHHSLLASCWQPRNPAKLGREPMMPLQNGFCFGRENRFLHREVSFAATNTPLIIYVLALLSAAIGWAVGFATT